MSDRIKLVMLGDQSTGKTALVLRYAHNEFYNTYQGTIGIDFLTVTHTTGGITRRVQIWDTAGQERFRSLIPSYVRDSRIALIVFDVCSVKSYENVQWWLDMIAREKNYDNLIVGLVGNKIDKDEERMISSSDARTLARDNNVFYMETSAKTGHKVKQLFTTAIEKFIETKSLRSIDEATLVNVNLQSSEAEESNSTPSNSCCTIL